MQFEKPLHNPNNSHKLLNYVQLIQFESHFTNPNNSHKLPNYVQLMQFENHFPINPVTLQTPVAVGFNLID